MVDTAFLTKQIPVESPQRKLQKNEHESTVFIVDFVHVFVQWAWVPVTATTNRKLVQNELFIKTNSFMDNSRGFHPYLTL